MIGANIWITPCLKTWGDSGHAGWIGTVFPSKVGWRYKDHSNLTFLSCLSLDKQSWKKHFICITLGCGTLSLVAPHVPSRPVWRYRLFFSLMTHEDITQPVLHLETSTIGHIIGIYVRYCMLSTKHMFNPVQNLRKIPFYLHFW